MKLVILTVGKEKDDLTQSLIKHFEMRILRYMPIEWMYIPHESTAIKEGEKILSHLKKEDYVVLLDEKGKDVKSEVIAELIENRMVDSVKRMIFIIGGAYGVSDAVMERANYTWKLYYTDKVSALLSAHLLVRVLSVELVYRALTIIKGEKYHHD